MLEFAALRIYDPAGGETLQKSFYIRDPDWIVLCEQILRIIYSNWRERKEESERKKGDCSYWHRKTF